MNTPICDFVNGYIKENATRLHMPGHKGKGGFCEVFDITEVDGADVLYSAEGIIEESQNNASALFCTGATFYSCEGSSLCIRAMLYLAIIASDKKSRRVVAARNSHKTFLSAAALLDLDIDWIYGDGDCLISSSVSAKDIEYKLENMDTMPIAVYITSPDYLGNMTDISAISKVCRRFGVMLIVDNAHGAYLNFLDKSSHPIYLGADMCCDSAHKTLPVLTGGAYLHISENADDILAKNAKRAMSMFASTSPSYLILQSLDRANEYLATAYRDELASCVRKTEKLKKHISDLGFSLVGDEKIKITVSPKSFGYTGEELYAYLKGQGIVCEFADKDYLVMMLTPSLDQSDFEKIAFAFGSLERKAPINEVPPKMCIPTAAMSPRRAMEYDFEELSASKCQGRILAADCVCCPPAIPIVACGEKIDTSAVKLFEYYGIDKLKVIL